jgi:hypothetical protein
MCIYLFFLLFIFGYDSNMITKMICVLEYNKTMEKNINEICILLLVNLRFFLYDVNMFTLMIHMPP